MKPKLESESWRNLNETIVGKWKLKDPQWKWKLRKPQWSKVRKWKLRKPQWSHSWRELCRHGSRSQCSHGLCLRKCFGPTPEKNYLTAILVIIMVIIFANFMVIIFANMVIFLPVPTEHRSPSSRTYAGHCCRYKLNTMAGPPWIWPMRYWWYITMMILVETTEITLITWAVVHTV